MDWARNEHGLFSTCRKDNPSPPRFIFVGMPIYWTKTPGWLRMLYPQRVWHIPTQEKVLYLTFDDGPHPEATPFVLEALKQFQAKATFFCIGKNVQAHPELYQRLLQDGHAVGNHTQTHVNGWKTSDDQYWQNVLEAKKYIGSDWFRPPYGRMRSSQSRLLRKKFPNLRIAMWEVLSGDFDESRHGDWCAKQVIKHAGPGSIVVFHDSAKAFDRLSVCLPQVLQWFNSHGFRFERLPDS